MERDGHLAQCLSEVNMDVTWWADRKLAAAQEPIPDAERTAGSSPAEEGGGGHRHLVGPELTCGYLHSEWRGTGSPAPSTQLVKPPNMLYGGYMFYWGNHEAFPWQSHYWLTIDIDHVFSTGVTQDTVGEKYTETMGWWNPYEATT